MRIGIIAILLPAPSKLSSQWDEAGILEKENFDGSCRRIPTLCALADVRNMLELSKEMKQSWNPAKGTQIKSSGLRDTDT